YPDEILQKFDFVVASVHSNLRMTEEKAINHLKKNNALAKACADNFPVKDSIVSRETITFDTTTIEEPITDFLVEDTKNYSITPCKPVKETTYITKTIRKDSIIFQRDLAQESVLKDEIKKYVQTLQERDNTIAVKNNIIQQKETRIKQLSKYMLWFSLAILALLMIQFRKPIGGLVLRLSNPLK
ncbi:MAG: hypothetical protein EOO01_11490, partial [Chitinophagaceae bacterium]